MKKIISIVILILLSNEFIHAEPYRPYPIICLHGYGANHYEHSNFGLLMALESNVIELDRPEVFTRSSKVLTTKDGKNRDYYYCGKDIARRFEDNKLAYYCRELNEPVRLFWDIESSLPKTYNYWLRSDVTNEMRYEEPVFNVFLETIEFDYPLNGGCDINKGTSESGYDKDYLPHVPQIGRARELILKLKETLINYYTDGIPYYDSSLVSPGEYYLTDVKVIRKGHTEPETLSEDMLQGDAKVIFVAHSFGGVNLRQMLCELAWSNQKWLVKYIHKIITVNTPHLGSPGSDQAFDPRSSIRHSPVRHSPGRHICSFF